jgi:hypothetical protein
MAKPSKPPLPDFQYIDRLIHGLEQNEVNHFTLPDGTTQEGHLLKYHEFEQVQIILMMLRSYVHKKPPGPERYETFWEAYCAQPLFRRYLEEEEKYVKAHGTERGKRAFALKSVAENNLHKQETLGKQIDKWNKLPLTRGE